MSTKETINVFIIAGEPSGDTLGRMLIRSLQCSPHFSYTFVGIGGRLMEEAGQFSSLVPMEKLSLTGFDIIKNIRGLWRILKKTCRTLDQQSPHILLTIDSPEFSLRVAKKIRYLPIKKIHVVAPSVWAWRPRRAKKIARFLDHLGCLFPFEPPLFEAHGLSSTFLGHPLCETLPQRTPRKEKEDPPHLLLMPGSRRDEIKTLLPVFLKTIQQLRTTLPHLHLTLLTLPHLEELVKKTLAGHSVHNLHLVSEQTKHIDSIQKATAALVASGTATLELALHNLPMVVGYRLSPVFYWLLKKCVRVKNVALPNILLKKTVVPECIQDNCTPDQLYKNLLPLLTNQHARKKQTEVLKTLQTMLSTQNFSQKVCEMIRPSATKLLLPDRQADDLT